MPLAIFITTASRSRFHGSVVHDGYSYDAGYHSDTTDERSYDTPYTYRNSHVGLTAVAQAMPQRSLACMWNRHIRPAHSAMHASILSAAACIARIKHDLHGGTTPCASSNLPNSRRLTAASTVSQDACMRPAYGPQPIRGWEAGYRSVEVAVPNSGCGISRRSHAASSCTHAMQSWHMRLCRGHCDRHRKRVRNPKATSDCAPTTTVTCMASSDTTFVPHAENGNRRA